MRKLHERLYEHKITYESQLRSHCYVHNHKLDIQILTQAPTNEPNPELWLKQKEYYWISKLGTLTKFNPKGLNKLIYDPIFRT